jgi:hypothetical protein
MLRGPSTALRSAQDDEILGECGGEQATAKAWLWRVDVLHLPHRAREVARGWGTRICGEWRRTDNGKANANDKYKCGVLRFAQNDSVKTKATADPCGMTNKKYEGL